MIIHYLNVCLSPSLCVTINDHYYYIITLIVTSISMISIIIIVIIISSSSSTSTIIIIISIVIIISISIIIAMITPICYSRPSRLLSNGFNTSQVGLDVATGLGCGAQQGPPLLPLGGEGPGPGGAQLRIAARLPVAQGHEVCLHVVPWSLVMFLFPRRSTKIW